MKQLSKRVEQNGFPGWKNCHFRQIKEFIHRTNGQAKTAFRTKTTQNNPAHPVADNDWARFPSPEQINQAWVSDITYIFTAEGLAIFGWHNGCLLAKIFGWHTRNKLETPLVTEAWSQAKQTRQPSPGLLHHSDRGG